VWPAAANEVTITIDGPARLLGLESGDLASHENYKSNKRKLFNGKLRAYIQSNDGSNVVRIKIDSPALPLAIVTIASTK
jgi:beta-galactosidase